MKKNFYNPVRPLSSQKQFPPCAAPHLMPHPPTPVSHRARTPIPCAAAKVKVKTTYVHHAETQSDFCDLLWSLRHSDSRLGGSCKNVAARRVPCVSAPEIVSRCGGTQRQLRRRRRRRRPFMKMSDHLRRIEWGLTSRVHSSWSSESIWV